MRKKKMTFENLELFLAAVAVLYPFDKLAPGVTVAYLPDGRNKSTPGAGVYYASLKLYNDRNPNEQEIIGKATGETLADTLKDLMQGWLNRTQAAVAFQVAMSPVITRRTSRNNFKKRKAVRRGRP